MHLDGEMWYKNGILVFCITSSLEDAIIKCYVGE